MLDALEMMVVGIVWSVTIICLLLLVVFFLPFFLSWVAIKSAWEIILWGK